MCSYVCTEKYILERFCCEIKRKKTISESQYFSMSFSTCTLCRMLYVPQMLCFIQLHFDILLCIVMTQSQSQNGKHYWKIFVREMRSTWNLDSIRIKLFVYLHTEREWIKPPSDWLLIDLVIRSKEEFVWMFVCVHASVCVWVLSLPGLSIQVGLPKSSRRSQEHEQTLERSIVYFFC